MKKYIISQNSISYQDGKVVMAFPVDKGVPGYDSRTNNFTQPFVTEIDGQLYMIKPEDSVASEDGRFIFISAAKPERTMNHAEIVGWAVKCAREEAGMSCEEVAERAGVKAMTIEKIEEGRFLANVVMLGRVAEAMNMEITLKPIE